jgi:ATP-dependent Clp protease protease subunit
MPKKPIDLPRSAGRLLNRTPTALGPGVLRLAADEAAEEAEVFIYGDIGGWWGGVSAEEFAKEIAALDVDTMNVRLNSPGGLVFDGVAIYNALARHAANVVVHVEGIAASIASVIAMAGDEIRIAEGSRFMIHNPWSFAMGDEDAFRAEADVLTGLKQDLIDIYAARTEQSRNDLSEWMTSETWFSAREAVDKGFADSMTPAKKKEKKDAHARSAVVRLFRNAPQDLLAVGGEQPQIRELERLLRDGEGLTHAQARRVAAQARALLGLRDEAEIQPKHSLRDEGAAASKLVEHLRALTR